jgi:hypothetical protein
LSLGAGGGGTADFTNVRRNQIAKFRVSIAAVADQKPYERPHSFNVRTVDDGAPLAGAPEQACPDQNGQMGRKRIVPCANGISDHAGGDPDRLVLDK